MAGTNPGFDAAAFRTAIRFVQDMAAPPLEAEQAIFYAPTTLVYTGSLDDDDVPFDPSTTVVRQPGVGVKVPCGIEYLDVDGLPIVFGTVTPSKVKITLLDEEYAQVKDAAYVVIAGEKYVYSRTEPPSGLFDVGLYVMRFTAENEL